MIKDATIDVLALDLEGTLILNAANPLPRPGLYPFLEFCHSKFRVLVVYTAVDDACFREIAAQLIARGEAPSCFAELPHYHWDYRNVRYKDLRLIHDSTEEKTAIIDDAEQAVHPDQREHWIPIAPFELLPHDCELERLTAVLGRLAAKPVG